MLIVNTAYVNQTHPTIAGAEAYGFIETFHNVEKGLPDVELVFSPGAITGDTGGSLRMNLNVNETIYRRYYGPYEGRDAFSIVPVLLRPYSRGEIKLSSKDPLEKPLIYHNYYSDERDLITIVQGIREAIKIGLGKGYQKYGSTLIPNSMIGCEQEEWDSNNYWACVAKHFTTNLQHQVGTAKMGPDYDPMSVVDERLRLKTINGLRIVDGSVIPKIPRGHTHGIIVMISEKASDIIKEDWNL